MQLAGSCQCRAVRFGLRSRHAVPYQRCYCTLCRKTQGGGGYAVNLSGDSASLTVEGLEHITIYHGDIRNPGQPDRISTGERHFCKLCGTMLWLYDPAWPELIHPFASAIDTPLPVPPEHTHLMLASKPDWVEFDRRPGDLAFDHYPKESIAHWHQRHGLET